MLGDLSEPSQLVAKEAMAILAGVCVSVADDMGVGVGDGQMAVHPLLILDPIVDRVVVGTKNDALLNRQMATG